jgi:hypothetical protein
MDNARDDACAAPSASPPRGHPNGPATAIARAAGGIERSKVAFFQGEPTYYVSSPGVRRGFCSRCGSTLSYEGERWPGEIHLHIGAFDDPSLLAPTGQAFADERLPWLHIT